MKKNHKFVTMKKNFKDTITNIAAGLGAVSGIIVSIASAGVAIPTYVVTAGIVSGALSVGIIGFFTGKTNEGKAQ